MPSMVLEGFSIVNQVTPMGSELLANLRSSWSEFSRGTTTGTTPDSVTKRLLAVIETEFEQVFNVVAR